MRRAVIAITSRPCNSRAEPIIAMPCPMRIVVAAVSVLLLVFTAASMMFSSADEARAFFAGRPGRSWVSAQGREGSHLLLC